MHPRFPSNQLQDSAPANIVVEKVWKVALDTGANVLALNVLETEGEGNRANADRNFLNYRIIHHQQER